MAEKEKTDQNETVDVKNNQGIDNFLKDQNIKVASKNKVSDQQILKEIQALETKKVDKDKVLELAEEQGYERKLRPHEIASQYHKVNQKHITDNLAQNTLKIYSESDLVREKKAKRNLLIFYFSTLAVFLGIVITFLVLSASIPYGSNKKTVYMAINIGVSILYGCFSYAFFSLKFYYQSKYTKMLGFLNTGLKETATLNFVQWEKKTVQREGVEFYEMLFTFYNEEKGTDFERKVLFDVQKPQIKLEPNQKATIVTQGNILIEYKLD